MICKHISLLAAVTLPVVVAHSDHGNEQTKIGPHKSLWYNTLPGDGGTQVRRQSPV